MVNKMYFQVCGDVGESRRYAFRLRERSCRVTKSLQSVAKEGGRNPLSVVAELVEASGWEPGQDLTNN